MSESPADDLPPENTDPFPDDVNPIDDAETDVPALPIGTPGEIQAMLEEPTGVHVVSTGDGDDDFSVVETSPATEPGVETRWELPEVLQEDKQVIASETGAGTAAAAGEL